MATLVIPFAGPGTPDVYSTTATVVGATPLQTNDGDTSYVDTFYNAGGADPFEDTVRFGPLDASALPANAQISRLQVRFIGRSTANGTVQPEAGVQVVTGGLSGGTFGSYFNPTFAIYNWPFFTTTYAEYLWDLNGWPAVSDWRAGNVYGLVGSFQGSPTAPCRFTYAEVIITYTGAVPLRHRNRDDGLANSMARKGPHGPSSSQFSSRRGPRAYS